MPFIAILVRDEHIQLPRHFVLFTVARVNENETLFSAPATGLPSHFEKAATLIQVAPTFTPFDDAFKLGETLERHADGALDTFAVQPTEDRT